MASFIKNIPYGKLARSRGVRRMTKRSRARLQTDLEAYAVGLGLLAREFARVQNRKIVKPEHVRMAIQALNANVIVED